jgi:hypothetical protein
MTLTLISEFISTYWYAFVPIVLLAAVLAAMSDD